MTDMQAVAFREASPYDWADVSAFEAVGDDLPLLSPDTWDELRWDWARREPKTLDEARRALASRVVNAEAPDDDAAAYDHDEPDGPQHARNYGAMRPLTAGNLWVPWLADAARSMGLRVVLVPGHASRGHGGMRVVEGVVGHHTATSDAARGDYPSLNIVTNGRAGLRGPLCNLGLGRDGTVYVVAAGTGYHAGASRHAGFTDLNDEFIGIEAEDNGDGRWTAAQLDAYPRLVAGLLRYMRRGPERYVSHRDCAIPRGRKPDPAGISDEWMRQRVAALLAAPGGATTPDAGNVNMPGEANRMRSINLTNDNGDTPNRSAVLTIDGVGRSIVMPKGSRAWCQFSAVFPFEAQSATARVEWLVVTFADGTTRARDPFNFGHRAHGSFELGEGAVAVEVVVRGLPKGAAIGWHLDGIGHA